MTLFELEIRLLLEKINCFLLKEKHMIHFIDQEELGKIELFKKIFSNLKDVLEKKKFFNILSELIDIHRLSKEVNFFDFQ